MSPLAHADPGGRLIRRFALALVALSAACSGVDDPERDNPIWITPSRETTLTVGDTLRMTATIHGRSPCACQWSGSDPAVASVSPDGLVRALAPGYLTVVATLVRDPMLQNAVLILVVGG